LHEKKKRLTMTMNRKKEDKKEREGRKYDVYNYQRRRICEN